RSDRRPRDVRRSGPTRSDPGEAQWVKGAHRSLGRIAQFVRELFHFRRPLGPEELARVAKYLTPNEEALFWQMSRRDQHHAIAVSIKAERLARHRGVWDGAEIRTLIRAGLLHDIGRVRGEV